MAKIILCFIEPLKIESYWHVYLLFKLLSELNKLFSNWTVGYAVSILQLVQWRLNVLAVVCSVLPADAVLRCLRCLQSWFHHRPSPTHRHLWTPGASCRLLRLLTVDGGCGKFAATLGCKQVRAFLWRTEIKESTSTDYMDKWQIRDRPEYDREAPLYMVEEWCGSLKWDIDGLSSDTFNFAHSSLT